MPEWLTLKEAAGYLKVGVSTLYRWMEVSMSAARIMVEYVWDDEARAWGFVVPALHIVGGGPTREDALRRAREAIAVALETAEVTGMPEDTEFLNVQVG